jgi:hypothetical protein
LDVALDSWVRRWALELREGLAGTDLNALCERETASEDLRFLVIGFIESAREIRASILTYPKTQIGQEKRIGRRLRTVECKTDKQENL